MSLGRSKLIPLGTNTPGLLVAVGVLCVVSMTAKACNEAVCASVVSKCMLTQSCKCDLVTCTCCKECFSCLSYLYDECCSCVDLCPKPNITANPLSKKSHVEDFSEPVPGLFQALTSEQDPQERWLTFTFPVDFTIPIYPLNLEKDDNDPTQTVEDIPSNKPNIVTVNCTVAYMSQCNSWNKCRASCQSMGATSYRWFHDGCCECIGNTCINYGINESRCAHCSLTKDTRDDHKNQYDDYGQDEEDQGEEDFD